MTFTQLTARLKNFLRGWLLALGIKEDLVECATVCVKSEVILKYMDFALLVSIHRNLSNDLVSVYSFRIRCRQSRYFPISLVQKGINSGLVIWVLYRQ